jgi:hypothetical protein
MMKIYTKTLIVFLLMFVIKTNAQCSGCTINVTGLDATNHIISSGQTMCVSPTGTVTGLITVSSGGTLCNQGKIGSTNVWIAGGTFKNYGTIDTYSVTISSAGTFTNYSMALIDSLWITHSNTTYINNGTQTGTAFAVTNHGTATNNGTITVYNHGDSLGTFTNNGTMNITHDCANSYTSSYTNNGNITIANDFANSYSSNFMNNNYMNVQRDFFNSTSADFTTKCMMNSGRDWYNSANVYGPSTPACGGFNITGASYNTGIVGSTGTHIDLCDAGHPALGIDGPGGTIAGTTTYCTCTNNCIMVTTSVQELKPVNETIIGNVFPNPANSHISVKLVNKKTEVLMVEVRDMMGRTVLTRSLNVNAGENELQLNLITLAQGTYILCITDSDLIQTKRMFNVSK